MSRVRLRQFFCLSRNKMWLRPFKKTFKITNNMNIFTCYMIDKHLYLYVNSHIFSYFFGIEIIKKNNIFYIWHSFLSFLKKMTWAISLIRWRSGLTFVSIDILSRNGPERLLAIWTQEDLFRTRTTLDWSRVRSATADLFGLQPRGSRRVGYGDQRWVQRPSQ